MSDQRADWHPTHRIPGGGADAWSRPDPDHPAQPLDPDLEVQALEHHGDWTHVLCSNGWTTWVDGRLLEPLATEAPVTYAPVAAPRPRRRRSWLLTLVVLLGVVAVGLVSVLAFRSDDTQQATSTTTDTQRTDGGLVTAPPATGLPGAQPPPSTGVAVTEPVTDLMFFADLDAVEPAAPPSGPADLTGGPTDHTSARVMRRDLEAAGHDLTGLGIDVFPIAGVAGSLLVISADADTALLSSDDSNDADDEGPAPGEQFTLDLFAIVNEYRLDVVQVAIVYDDVDEDRGPYTATITFSADALRRAVDTDEDIEDLKVQVVMENER